MDLHIHSTKSDGELSPKQIITTAFDTGIKVISITDHDEIDGYNQAKAEADRLGIRLIPGIELNTDGEEGELHILGYHFDPISKDLLSHIEWRTKDRMKWAEKIVHKLQEMDYAIDFKSCLSRAKGKIIVRTHIADELVDKGYFLSSKQAYTELLQKNAPAFVDRGHFCAKDAIDLIHRAGGEAYLAHPGIYPFEISLDRLISYGLDGIEVYHSKHTKEQTDYWEQKATHLGLKRSGGSDHHGPYSRNPYPIGSVQLGTTCLKQWDSMWGVK